MTKHCATKLPSAVVAVMVAVPALFAVTRPFTTDAIEEFEELHVTFLFVALLGVTVAVSDTLFPTVSVSLVLLSVMPATGY